MLIKKQNIVDKGVNIQEIKQQYPSLKGWSDDYAYILYQKIQEHQVITEFLYTVDVDKTVDTLNKSFKGIHSSDDDDNTILVKFKNLDTIILDTVNKKMDAFGYFPSIVGVYSGGGKYSDNIKQFIGRTDIVVKYEAKYDVETEIEVTHMFHITPDINYKKIKSLGLTPKTQSKIANHPGRIYLTYELSPDGLEDFMFALYNINPNKEYITDMYVLAIDMEQIKDHKFFIDPNFKMGEGAVYTYQNIPPSAISIDERVNVKTI